MSAEVTISGSLAVLKTLYHNGVPKTIQERFPLWKELSQKTDWQGDGTYNVALQNAYPQGVGGSVATAQAAAEQSKYVKFIVSRKKHYAVARVSGEVLKGGKTANELVDLWKNETEGVVATEMVSFTSHLYGSGDGVIGAIASGVATATVTLQGDTNMNYFSLGQLLQCVDTAGLSPVVRVGQARVIGIDRKNKKLTFSGALTASIPAATNTDLFVRYGETSSGGSNPAVFTGLRQYFVGGTTPGVLHQLNRDVDPVSLAGQHLDATGLDIGQAISDASSLLGYIGTGGAGVVVMNPLEYAKLKNEQSSRIIVDPGIKVSAGVKDVYIDGDQGAIRIISDPFCPPNEAYLLDPSVLHVKSNGGVSHLQNEDVKALRLESEDIYEARFATYGEIICTNPSKAVRFTGLGL